MIQVLFFARLREELETASLSLDFVGTVANLKAQLVEQGGENWRALAADNILCSINQQVAKDGHTVTAGDEVAFYPPVTGG